MYEVIDSDPYTRWHPEMRTVLKETSGHDRLMVIGRQFSRRWTSSAGKWELRVYQHRKNALRVGGIFDSIYAEQYASREGGMKGYTKLIEKIKKNGRFWETADAEETGR